MNSSNFKDYLEVITFLIGISTFVLQLARLERKIFQAIDNSSDILLERFNYLNSELRIHVTECNQIRKNNNYALRELKNRTDNLNKKLGGGE